MVVEQNSRLYYGCVNMSSLAYHSVCPKYGHCLMENIKSGYHEKRSERGSEKLFNFYRSRLKLSRNTKNKANIQVMVLIITENIDEYYVRKGRKGFKKLFLFDHSMNCGKGNSRTSKLN